MTTRHGVVLEVVDAPADLVRTSRPLRRGGVLAATLAALLFALNGAVSKHSLTRLSSIELVQVRAGLAAVVMFTVAAVTRPQVLRLDRREMLSVVAGGVVGIGILHWLYFVAIARLPIGIALLLQFLAPVIIAVWIRVVRRGEVNRVMWLSLLLCVAGLALVTQIWDGMAIDGLGVLAGLGGAVALAGYYLLTERGVTTAHPLGVAAYSLAAGGAFSLLFRAPWRFRWDRLDDGVLVAPLHRAVPLWALITWSVACGTLVGYLLMLRAVARLGSAHAGLVGMLEPVAAAPIAWWWLGERLSATQIAGGMVVLAGIVLAESARRRRAPPEPPGARPPTVAPATAEWSG